jgi:hypothetical protein
MKVFIIQSIFLFITPVFGQSAARRDSLKTALESVFVADQLIRLKSDTILNKYGYDSPQFQQVITAMNRQDSLNQQIVTTIIDKHGWLSSRETSDKANAALFLVIQHADLGTQLKYLPLLLKAVRDGKAKAADYVLLVDRTRIKQGKFQVYGSQISHEGSGKMYFYPIEDEPHVNARRKAVGLQRLEEYARRFGLAYTLPKVDTLKNKIVLIARLFADGRPLDSVTVYLGNNKRLGEADEMGLYKVAIDQAFQHWALIFRKEGYAPYAHVLDEPNKNLIEINISLRKK